jgi:sugar-specific transcriptional regulator TrmB
MNRHERVLRALQGAPTDLTAQEICRVIEVPAGVLDTVLDDLERHGHVHVSENVPRRYRFAKEY